MKKYIDRDALLKDICGNDPSHMEDYYFNAIANAPAADVVEVVRCKDCKHLMFSDCYGECSKAYLGIVAPWDFCSYGERK
jgi:hypothetical protein